MSLSTDGVWKAGVWATTVWADGVWRETLAVIASLTGTAATDLLEEHVVTGGRTLIITLATDTWVAAGATFNAQRQNIIDGLDSGGAESGGWNAQVRDEMAVTTVVRTSDTVVTITLPATAAYDISAPETITITVPSTALESGGAVVSELEFTITAASTLQHEDPNVRHQDSTNRHKDQTLRHNRLTVTHRQ